MSTLAGRDATRDYETLVRYLLGELTEPEQETVEERYLLHEDYAELKDEVEICLVDAYVCGTLSRVQRLRFEKHYLITPERKESVESACVLKAYRDCIARPAARREQWWWNIWPRQWPQHRRLFASLAAALIVHAAIGSGCWLLFRKWEARQDVAAVAVRLGNPAGNADSGITKNADSPKNSTGPATQTLPSLQPDVPVKIPPAESSLPPAPQIATNDPPKSLLPPVDPVSDRSLAATVNSSAAPCPAPAPVSAVPGPQKRRLAVDAFDYSAVRSNVTAIFNNDLNIGQGIRAMLTARMVPSKNVVLLEREKLATVMREQDLGNASRRASTVRIGGITGADAILYGDIVIFGRDDVSSKKSGAFAKGFGGPLMGGLATSKKTDKAVVAINLRLVDSETGEVLDSAEARGESTRKSTDWASIAGSFGGAAAAGSSMTSSNFQDTIIGEATADAVTKIVAFLDQRIPALPPKPRNIEGRVATLDGCTLYLSVGANDSVRVGDRFDVAQIIKEVVDPETHEVIDRQVLHVGDFVVGSVRDRTAIGQYGGAALTPDILAKPGYTARLIPR